ncbi:FKBP-type peptidyl-prolyl cis-trans isomerase [Mucilaginibacter sp. UR6-11]|uniref:FKBP-type peptidyl-prolyl cis-trans isomerase n=1 Tax=Mucilaginibacter sp. UR6-11 TaxID=1435644 RepID=UPI001E5E2618|nr:FKBP-type peptidyl-prolyl cis-trans isomerase [Mucilaginibacter sp. UR6-11]MCC8425953.1 FKBP-type peptidyl-prolyl cis-trans isomerase [Mucilaginibacter sp. UR6-11]
MKIIYLLTAFLIMLSVNASAQTRGLKIGDRLPEFTINNIWHGAQHSAEVADFKDRLLIIDFWATSCGGCVEALPKMESLQKQFGGRVKILPVTYETRAYTETFWKANVFTRKLTLPVVTDDKLFNKYFPHEVIPHEIWINKGKVIGITSEGYVDSYNIRQVLDGQIPNWPIKDDYYMFDGAKQPLFTPDENQIDMEGTRLEYAAICGYKEKNGASAAGPFGNSGIVRDSVHNTVRVYFINQSILSIYTTCWNKLVKLGKLVKPSVVGTVNQTVWEVTDPAKYTHQTYLTPQLKTGYIEDWVREHAICFESQYKDNGQTDIEITQSVIADLDRLLGLHVGWQKRREKVWIVKAKPGRTANKNVKSNESLGSVLYQINQQPGNPYIFNETGIKSDYPVAVKLNSWTDIESIRDALGANGFELKEEERIVDKFVFAEVEGGLIVDTKKIRAAKARREAQGHMALPLAEENKDFLRRNKLQPGVIELPSGLQYKVIKTGTGNKPSGDSKVLVDYTGSFVNGKIFESSLEGGLPYVTKLTDVIKGWTEALQLMPTGSKWIIYVPAELAYGDRGTGNIPPNSSLIFELELLQITP